MQARPANPWTAVSSARPTASLWDMEIPEPVGVAALIIPWNDPIDLLIRKLGAALAAGCSVVHQAVGDHPCLDRTRDRPRRRARRVPAGRGEPRARARRADRRGARPASRRRQGRVHGLDGRRASGSPGSPPSGSRRSRSNAAARPRRSCSTTRISIRCLDSLAYGAFMYSGQSCTACTRLLVEDSVYDQVLDGIVDRARDLPRRRPHGRPDVDRSDGHPCAVRQSPPVPRDRAGRRRQSRAGRRRGRSGRSIPAVRRSSSMFRSIAVSPRKRCSDRCSR